MMYKKIIFVLCVAALAASCLKNSSNGNSCPYQPNTINLSAAERTAIDTYIDTNNIDAVKDPSGFYYKIITPGVGSDSMTLCSQIQISYKGQLTNDSIFDQRDNIVYVLGSLLEGWRRGIPLVKKGGEIKLYLPPTFGYGGNDIRDSTGRIVIPANSILKFDVRLTDYTAGN